jgi:aldose sugar dehydrogenase
VISCNSKIGVPAVFTWLILIGGVLVFQNCSANHRNTTQSGSLIDPKAPESSPTLMGQVTLPSPGSAVVPTLLRTDFLTGLNIPWDLAFTPDQAVLFTEKCRGLSVRRTNGAVSRLFGTAGSALVARDFFCEGQSGMHGIAIDPNFVNNRTIYVYMPSNLSNPRTNRVVRLVVDAGYTMVSGRFDIITDIPFKNVRNNWGSPGAHSGGRLRFGPDGYLYVTTGDNHHGTLPQDLTKLGGKVLRVDHNGAGAPGNNTPTGGDARIFTYGHRNVQGIAFHPTTKQAYIAEHGPGHTDEVTPLSPGGNGGWDPKPERGVSCADNYCGYTSNKSDGTLTPMTDLAKFPTALQPLWTNNGASDGTGPCTFLSGPQWKAWDGRLVVGIMASKRVEILQLKENGQLASATRMDLPSARFRSLVQGPDGYLYIATDEGAIWRVVPQ